MLPAGHAAPRSARIPRPRKTRWWLSAGWWPKFPAGRPSVHLSRAGISMTVDVGQLEQVDPAAIHPDDPGLPAGRAFRYAVGFISAQLHRVPVHRNAAELLEHQPADRLVFTLRRVIAGGGRHLVDAQQTRYLPTVAGRHHIRCGIVVFVADVADDFFDQTLDGHHPRNAAVLVDDHGSLQAVGADLTHQRVTVQRGGHYRDLLRDGGQQGVLPVGGRDLEDLLDVHHADGLVEVALDDREPGESTLGGGGYQVGDSVIRLQRNNFRARRHQLLGCQRADLQ